MEDRIAALEKAVERLHKIFAAEKTSPPMDRGMTFYPTGDAVPNRGPADTMAGFVFLLKENGKNVPLQFTKNDTRNFLPRGEAFKGGVVDTKLRVDEVPPNDFFYLEI
jgi:hypothetical protein